MSISRKRERNSPTPDLSTVQHRSVALWNCGATLHDQMSTDKLLSMQERYNTLLTILDYYSKSLCLLYANERLEVLQEVCQQHFVAILIMMELIENGKRRGVDQRCVNRKYEILKTVEKVMVKHKASFTEIETNLHNVILKEIETTQPKPSLKFKIKVPVSIDPAYDTAIKTCGYNYTDPKAQEEGKGKGNRLFKDGQRIIRDCRNNVAMLPELGSAPAVLVDSPEKNEIIQKRNQFLCFQTPLNALLDYLKLDDSQTKPILHKRFAKLKAGIQNEKIIHLIEHPLADEFKKIMQQRQTLPEKIVDLQACYFHALNLFCSSSDESLPYLMAAKEILIELMRAIDNYATQLRELSERASHNTLSKIKFNQIKYDPRESLESTFTYDHAIFNEGKPENHRYKQSTAREFNYARRLFANKKKNNFILSGHVLFRPETAVRPKALVVTPSDMLYDIAGEVILQCVGRNNLQAFLLAILKEGMEIQRHYEVTVAMKHTKKSR